MPEENLFKNETLEEARARLKAMSEAERESFAAASEGQAVVDRNTPEMQERAAQVDEAYDPIRDYHVEEGSDRPASEVAEEQRRVPRRGAEEGAAGGQAPAGEGAPAGESGEEPTGGEEPPRRRRGRGRQG